VGLSGNLETDEEADQDKLGNDQEVNHNQASGIYA
jgi:hypothetical protein